MTADNSALFWQQVYIMIIVQLKQGYFLRMSRICGDTGGGIDKAFADDRGSLSMSNPHVPAPISELGVHWVLGG